MAALAGAWTALVAGFGGLRDDAGELALDPQLPDGITRLRFRLRWKDFRVTVDVDHDEVKYALRDGPDRELSIRHAGEKLDLNTDSSTTVRVRRREPLLPPPPQPPGREQIRRPSVDS
jgi:trehalose/maltose hydrolase-like predicted phosphorylase